MTKIDNQNKLTDSLIRFSRAVKEFKNDIAEIDSAYKKEVNLTVLLDICFSDIVAVQVLGGTREGISYRLDRLRKEMG